ncbi:MAG: hypothetical protein LBT84_00215 [Spirochaetia bacterium]|jgi:hypothetical protein|nr:hypothetical protein [Spirochaetia bacterium]
MNKLFLIITLILTADINLFAQSAAIQNGGQFILKDIKEEVVSDMWTQPPEGMKFVAFDILIDNTNGNDKIQLDFDGAAIEIKDSQGYSLPLNFVSYDIVKPSMKFPADIEKGDLLRGWITVAIRKESPLNTLRIRIKTNTQSGWIVIKK